MNVHIQNVPLRSPPLENRVDNVASNCSTGTKDRSITQLLSKLLAHPTRFTGRTFTTLNLLLLGLIRHSHRGRASVIGVLLLLSRRRRVPTIHGLRRRSISGLFVVVGVVIIGRGSGGSGQGLDVGTREDTLRAGAFVAAHPPIGIHVLVHLDGVVALEADVAGVGGCVGVEGFGVGDDGFGGWWGWGAAVAGGESGWGGGGGLVVGRGSGGVVVVVEVEVVEGVAWRRSG